MFSDLNIPAPLSFLFFLLSLPSHPESWHIPLAKGQKEGRWQQVGDAEHWHPHSCTPAVARMPGAPQGRVGGCLSTCLSVCQHGRWGNGIKQVSLTCAPMSALCAGLPLWLPSPQLCLPGDWRQTSRQAGEKPVLGGLDCQPKGWGIFQTTGLEISYFLLPGLWPDHAVRGTELSLQEREDAFGGYKFYWNR